MNYPKRCNSNNSTTTTSSINSSSNSHSGSESQNVVSNTLEHCTAASSPYALVSVSAGKTSCPASSSKLSSSSSTSTVVSEAIDEVIVPSSGNSSQSPQVTSSSNTSSSSSSSLSLSASSYSASIYRVCSPSHNAAKRKRRSSANQTDKDTELGFEPPLAKRQQRLPSLYQSEPGSVVSSVYPSPVDELVNDIDTHTSSECLSTATGYDVAHHDDIPDSPNSLQNEQDCNDDDDDDVDDDDDEEEEDEEEFASSSAGSPSNCCTVSSQAALLEYATLHPSERTPAQKHAASSPTKNSNPMTTAGISKPKVKSFDAYASAYDCPTPAADPEPPRFCPLPLLAWGHAHEVWQLMCKKDEHATCMRDVAMLDQHPGLQPRMRAILLDWLMEVCEVYKLHRETYYLAVDYLDRYLSALKKVQKTQLQLIGITCLFVAAKVEEIYPPKIGEFAYVTDGACQDTDILKHEILLLQALEWNISPVTPMAWLGVYMQLNVNNRTPKTFNPAQQTNTAKRIMQASTSSSATNTINTTDDAFIYPQYSGMEFVQTAQLLDLCSLDVGFANFPYSVIAAAAVSHTFDRDTALRCSGLDWQTIEACVRWMLPFFEITSIESKYLQLAENNEQLSSKFGLGHICPNIVTDDSHIIQTHTTTMTMFDQVWQLREQYQANALKIMPEASPATGLLHCHEGLLTPPASSRKPLGVDNDDNDRENRKNIVDKNEKTL